MLASILLLIVVYNVIEHLSTVFRLLGASEKSFSIGQHLSLIVMLGNRVCSAGLLICLGFVVDGGTSISNLLIVYIFSSVFLSITFVFFAYSNSAILWFYSFLRDLLHPQVESSLGPDLYAGLEFKIKLDKTIVFTNFLFIFGFLSPALVASYMPDYRATFMQTGFLLNGIASILTAFTVEKRIARTCQNGLVGEIRQLEVELSVSKAFGAVIAALLFSFLLMFLF
jgi:hypothetical protein